MDFDKLTSVVARTFFFGAFVLLVMAVVERLLNMVGASLPGVLRLSEPPSRLLEWAVILLVFVIAMLLRQIREGLKKSRTA